MAVVVIHLSLKKKNKKKLQSLKNYKGQPAQHLCNGDALMRLHSAPESLFQNRFPMLLWPFSVQHHFKCARAHAEKYRQT